MKTSKATKVFSQHLITTLLVAEDDVNPLVQVCRHIFTLESRPALPSTSNRSSIIAVVVITTMDINHRRQQHQHHRKHVNYYNYYGSTLGNV